MKNIRYIYPLVCCLLFGCLAACSDSEEIPPVVPEGELCELSIQIGASGTTETRFGDDVNAREGEYINSLCVFVVNDNDVIEAKWLPDLTGNTDAQAGNLQEWRSTVVEIPEGHKTIYAFANWKNAGSDAWETWKTWETIIAKEVNGTLSDADLNITLDDPASKVDFSKKQFIPMSVKDEMDLTAASQSKRIELIRLVARVDATIYNNTTGTVTLKEFTMKSFADKVALMPNGTAAGVSNDNEVSYLFLDGNNTIKAEDEYPFYIYVNETLDEDNAVFSVKLDSYSGTMQNQTNTIQRNYYLPLALNIGEDDLTLEVYVAPIGVYPFTVPVTGRLTGTTYTAEIPEGSSFRVKDGEEYCTISEVSPSNIIAIDDGWAHVTAVSAQTATLTAVNPQGRRYTINITTTVLGDYTRSATLRWSDTPGWSIPIPLSRPECNEGHK